MTEEKFKQLIEAPTINVTDRMQMIKLRGAIGRTVRLTLQYPNEAKIYYDSLPRVVNENIPTNS